MSGVVTLGGERVTEARVFVPSSGPWFADLELEADPALSGKQTLHIGERSFVGTLDPRHTGVFGLRMRCRLVAGAGNWGGMVKPRAYHNDAGVKARSVLDDAARDVGETLGTVTPATDRIGNDYVRQSGIASTVLEDVIGAATWWVDYAGVTQVGTRAKTTPVVDSYDVSTFDSRSRVASLDVDDVGAVGIGSEIKSELLDGPQTVRELEIVVTPEKLRVIAWCGGTVGSASRLGDALRAIIKRTTDDKLFGKYRYRVVKNAGENRLNLQAVRKGAGLPDLLPISMWPGMPASLMDPDEGSEVLVEFIEGDRTMPVVTSFAGGSGAAAEVAYKGAAVKVLMPPAVFAGTLLPPGLPPVPLNAPAAPTGFMSGTIEAGSPNIRVKIQ